MCWKIYNCDYIMNVILLIVEFDFFVSILLVWKSLEGFYFFFFEVFIIYIVNERVKRKKVKEIERDNIMVKIKISIFVWLILEYFFFSILKY